MSNQTFSAARIQLTVLSLIATAASAIAGGILLVVGMTAEAPDAGFQLEDLAVLGAFLPRASACCLCPLRCL